MTVLTYALLSTAMVVLVVLLLICLYDCWSPGEPSVQGHTRVRLHDARSRLMTRQMKYEIRATSARMRRDLAREMSRRHQGDDR